MLRRVVPRSVGAVGHAQTYSRGSFQLVLRDGKHAPLIPCVSSSAPFHRCQIRPLTNTRFHAAAEAVATVEIPIETAVTPQKRTRAKKPVAKKAASTKTGKKSAGGRTKKSTTKAAKAQKKAVPEKKRPAAKKPAAKKPAAKKPAAKKRVVKKPLQPSAVYYAKAKALKEQALLKMPKLLPDTQYFVFMVERHVTGAKVSEQAKTLSAEWKALSLGEVEHYKNIAKQNKVENEKTIQSWLEQYTPDQVRLANNARRQLNKLAKAPLPEGRKISAIRHSYSRIKDPRAVKRGDTGYMIYVREGWAANKFNGKSLTEMGQMLGAEWKAMSPEKKQKYVDAGRANMEQYHKDYNAIFTKGKKSPAKSSIEPIAG